MPAPDSDPPATEASSPPQRPKRVLWALVGFGIPGLIVLAFTIAMIVPTDLESLSEEHAAFSHGTAKGAGDCALTSVRAGDGCAAVPVLSVRTEEIAFPAAEGVPGVRMLRGTLHSPEPQGGRRSAVVLVHGSGPSTRAGNVRGDVVHALKRPLPLLEQLADALARDGLIVLRYDKRTCTKCYAETVFDPKAFRFEHFVADVGAALDALAKRDDVRGDALSLVAVDQGSVIATAAAAKRDDVAAVAVLGGFLSGFERTLIGQHERLESIRMRQWDPFGALNVRSTRIGMQRCFDALDDAAGDDAAGDDECIGEGVTQRALKEYDQLAAGTVQRLRAGSYALFALQGSVDRNVAPERFFALKGELAGRDAELHYVRGVDHSLTALDVDPRAPVVAPVVLERLRAFFSRVEGS